MAMRCYQIEPGEGNDQHWMSNSFQGQGTSHCALCVETRMSSSKRDVRENTHVLIHGHRGEQRIHVAGDRAHWQSVATTAMHRRMKSEEEGSSRARR
jgi:hypothetical protein